jgi:hypothetical protein
LGAADYVPLFVSGTKLVEQVQYTEPDGTLVTYAGFRPTARHAREGGEDWKDPVDKGPGNYFAFPALYFQNRTWGLVIRDEVPAGRQKITAYLKPNMGTLVDASFNTFRRLDPGVIEYGWMHNGGYDRDRCTPTENIAEMCKSNPITDYWRFKDDRDYLGITSRPDNKLRIGDKIEMTAGVFLDHAPGNLVALIDGGHARDYSTELLYVVGKGMVPWYGAAPRLDTTPLPDDALLGGQVTVPYNYSEEPHRVFQQPAGNIGIANMQRFVEGRRLFHTSFVDEHVRSADRGGEHKRRHHARPDLRHQRSTTRERSRRGGLLGHDPVLRELRTHAVRRRDCQSAQAGPCIQGPDSRAGLVASSAAGHWHGAARGDR